MKKIIPNNKMSKRAKREEDLLKRNSWETNPITKVIPNKKKYNRKRDKSYKKEIKWDD